MGRGSGQRSKCLCDGDWSMKDGCVTTPVTDSLRKLMAVCDLEAIVLFFYPHHTPAYEDREWWSRSLRFFL